RISSYWPTGQAMTRSPRRACFTSGSSEPMRKSASAARAAAPGPTRGAIDSRTRTTPTTTAASCRRSGTCRGIGDDGRGTVHRPSHDSNCGPERYNRRSRLDSRGPQMSTVRPDSPETLGLLERAAAGDDAALGELIARHRDAVRRFVELRLDPKIRGRIDASDVVQEAHLEAVRRIEDYLARR